MDKKSYPSKIKYTKKWNKSNINVSIDRELVENLKTQLNDKSLKSVIEDMIKNYLANE